MYKFSSLFAVKKDDVKQASENAISQIKEKREKLWEDAVEKEFHTRFFKAKTRADAERRAKCNESLPVWKIQGWGTESRAKRLLAAFSVCCEDVVYLSGDDAEFVNEWR